MFERIAGTHKIGGHPERLSLIHICGGDRSATVKALPVLIDALRAHGYAIVQVSALMGKTTAEVMPQITLWQYLRALPDSIAFSGAALIVKFIVYVFFLGDILMSARLLIVGLFAIIDRLRKPYRQATPGYGPRVAVLIPAYNEETVIVRTIRSVLNSDYKNLHIIVVDDGSLDRTFDVVREAYAAEIAAGRLQVFSKPNGGKASALNFALDRISEEVYVGIDADTVIAADAISRLIPHFEDPRIGAMAGNAKVGNRVNLWTRWQALEYITSQNFERRALDLFHVVTVVPGAIGAWRTAPVKAAGGYPLNTVAEDADLTMNLLEQGLRVDYEDRALAYTEAPIDAKGPVSYTHLPHYQYIDEDNNQRHIVWFLDGVTLLNELRAARQLGLSTFALWRLGEEDSSLWNVWDKPSDPGSLQALAIVQPGHDVDLSLIHI